MKKLRQLKMELRRAGAEDQAKRLERLEASMEASSSDESVGAAGKVNLDLGEAGLVTQIDDGGGTCVLLVKQGATGKSFVIFASDHLTVAQNGDDVDVSFE